jgi:hypothetical protein
MNEDLAYLHTIRWNSIFDEIDYHLRDIYFESDLMLIIANTNYCTDIIKERNFKQLLNYKKTKD